MKKGFTLIELLVVVLIIGILAAIAVPQYQKAVLKSRFTTLKNMTKALFDAEEAYYLANGKYTGFISDLDISIPPGNAHSYKTTNQTKDEESRYYDDYRCGISLYKGINIQIYCFLLQTKNGTNRLGYGYHKELTTGIVYRRCVQYTDKDIDKNLCAAEMGAKDAFSYQ